MKKLLLIEGSDALLSESFTRPPLLDDHWICDRVVWSSWDIESLGKRAHDVVVAQIVRGPYAVQDFFRWLREHPVGTPTIAVVPEDSDGDLLRACFEAVEDIVLWPVRPEELRSRICRVLGPEPCRSNAVRNRLNTHLSLANLIGTDMSFLAEIGKIPLAARCGSEVLITGETGTGKELCARALHQLSHRSRHPFVCVDCGAIPDHLFENEMFGHERGAFTDAHHSQRGLVAIAEGGTLFLDEVDSLSLSSQAKLLRFLEDSTYKPLGAEKFFRADVRIVAATNRNLERAVDESMFRRDLFFRINVLQIHVMPLRDRRGDIEPLAQHFLELCCMEMGGVRKVLTNASLELLRSLEWPGNVRELYNVIRRAVVFSEGHQILPFHLLPAPETMCAKGAMPRFREARAAALTTFEHRYVEDLLRKNDGNVTRAAREAGTERRTFGRLVKRHKLNPSTPL